MTGLNTESKRLLDTLFGTGGGWLWQGHYDANDKMVWKGEGPVGSFSVSDGNDLYYCIARLKGARTTKGAERVMVLVIDDVGKEIDRDAFDMTFPLEPSYVVETSQGSYQYGYFIEGGMDADEYQALRAAMKANPVWGGAHNIGPVGLFRLPQGTHTKSTRKGFRPREERWTGLWHTKDAIWSAASEGAPRAMPAAKRFEWTLGDEALQEVVDLIPNDLDRRDWITVAHGIAGAGGEFEIFETFCKRFTGGEDPIETVRVWETLPTSMSGGGVLRQKAEAADPSGFAAWKLKWENPFDDGGEAPGEDIDPNIGTRHFVAFLPVQKYIYVPTGDLWVKEAVNSVVPPVQVGTNAKGEPVTIRAASWLDRNCAVTQMSWLPGEKQMVGGKVVSEDGLRDHPTSAIYNLYVEPVIEAGDAGLAGPWLDHVRKLYPDDADHLFGFFAHCVQKPWEKVNHGVLLGGAPGIGKDTLLHPVLRAVGFSNTVSISPARVRETFNGYLQSVVLVIDEIRDLGDSNQWAFYEQCKTLLAAPPMTLLINEKFKPAYPVPNVVHVVMTTNSKCDGLYLPEDDRRHYVAWSKMVIEPEKAVSAETYFRRLWAWMENGGHGHVAAWLRAHDLTKFDAKAPPPRTKAFQEIVLANKPVGETQVGEALDAMGRPGAFTLDWLAAAASGELAGMLAEPKHRRHIYKWLEREGYEAHHNPHSADGRWRIGKQRQIIYADRKLTNTEKDALASSIETAKQAALDAIWKAGGGS